MTDTPILNSFLPALTAGLPTPLPGTVARTTTDQPLHAYEITDADADHIIRAHMDQSDPTMLLPDGKFDSAAMARRECSRAHAHGDLFRQVVAGRATLLAFTARHFLLSGRMAEPQKTVAIFVPLNLDGRDRVGLYNAWISCAGQWVRQVWPFVVEERRLVYYGGPRTTLIYESMSESERQESWMHDLTIGLASLAMLNRFLSKLTAHAEAPPIYRMSTGTTHRVYNKHRGKGGIMPGPVRILDLSKPSIVTIPIGPSMPTGRQVTPHDRRATMRRLESERFQRGPDGLPRVIPVRAAKVKGGASTGCQVVTLVKGLHQGKDAE